MQLKDFVIDFVYIHFLFVDKIFHYIVLFTLKTIILASKVVFKTFLKYFYYYKQVKVEENHIVMKFFGKYDLS
jgi:hypothetical protein